MSIETKSAVAVQAGGSGRYRTLFIGEIISSHAQSWMRLLDETDFEVRCFNVNDFYMPYPGEIRYLTFVPFGKGANDRPELLVQPDRRTRLRLAFLERRAHDRYRQAGLRWLAEIVHTWQPDLVHTFGLVAGSQFFHDARTCYGLERIGHWVAQFRGGSDLAFTRADPTRGPTLAAVARSADALISDNPQNFEYLEGLGVRVAADRRLIVPGTGGIDLDALASALTSRPSQRRLILWPKAYESPWSKALPVLEALRTAWGDLSPCRLVALAADHEVEDWLRLCPQPMRNAIELSPRVERSHVLHLMRKARVMLAPSLVDGTPNTMWEAMAAGAVPILSPLPTISPIVVGGENALFARNLYPEEIAGQLVRAMTDDALVDRIAMNNLAVVRHRADRGVIRPQVLDFYRRLVADRGSPA